GCGGGAVKTHESAVEYQVRTTVQGWLRSLTTGDNARACAYLAPTLQRAINTQLRIRGETGTCRTFAAKWTGGSTPPGHRGAHVVSVTVMGRKASAQLAAPPDRQSEVELLEIGRRWLIENY